MKTRERAIMDYTRRMGKLGAKHTEALTDATLSYLEESQAGNSRSAAQRNENEQRWSIAVWQAYQDWEDGRIRARMDLESVLGADLAAGL